MSIDQKIISDRSYLLLLSALVQVVEGGTDVLGEPPGEHVFVRTELVPRLTDDGVDDVQARNFVLRAAFLSVT